MKKNYDKSEIEKEICQQAMAFGKHNMTCEIALYTLLNKYPNEAERVFLQVNCDCSELMKKIYERNHLTKKMNRKVLVDAVLQKILRKWNAEDGLWKLTYSILLEGDIPFYYYNLDCTEYEFLEQLKKMNSDDKKEGQAGESGLKKIEVEYCTDLTYLASISNEIFFGREEELEQIITILMCRKKNNVLLLGEAGVGKTAIVEAFSKRIIEGKVPNALADAHVLSLNLAALLGGASGRGEFEERVQQMFQKIEQLKVPIILFIDEFHSIVGLGNEENFDLANLMKPILARRGIGCIGATTFREYKIYIEKDGALVRRFQNVKILEPSIEEAYQILCNVKGVYEAYHQVHYTEKAVYACVKLSDRYMKNRQLPDKAFDLMDEIGVVTQRNKQYEVTEQMVQQFMIKKYNIPIWDQTNLYSNGISHCMKQLSTIVGNKIQKDGLKKLLFTSQFMMYKGDVSNCVLKFCGISDCTKDKFIKAICTSFFASSEACLELDMSGYQEKHMLSKLIGAPPGYAGSQESGILINKLKNYSRILLEIKNIHLAHDQIIQFLRKVIQGSGITDMYGSYIAMTNSIVILNYCTESGKEENCEILDELALGEICFTKLSEKELFLIGAQYLQQIAKELSKQNITLIYHESVQTWLIDSIGQIQSEEQLKYQIYKRVIDVLSEQIMGHCEKNKKINLIYKEGNLEVENGGIENERRKELAGDISRGSSRIS